MKLKHIIPGIMITFLMLMPLTGQTQIKVGIGGGLVTDNSMALLQGRVEIGPHSFFLASSFNFILKEDVDWAIDIDGQYKVADINQDVYIHFFPGINLLKVTNDTDIGLNLGAALRIHTNRNVIYIEPKYTLGSYDSFAITGGFIF